MFGNNFVTLRYNCEGELKEFVLFSQCYYITHINLLKV